MFFALYYGRGLKLNKPEILKSGLNFFRSTSLDFVDCLLCAYHTEAGYEVCTFDKKLNKLIEKSETRNDLLKK